MEHIANFNYQLRLDTPEALVEELHRVMLNFRSSEYKYDAEYVAETVEALVDRYDVDSTLRQNQNAAKTTAPPTSAP